MQTVQRLITTFVPAHYKLSLDIKRTDRKFDGTVNISGSSPENENSIHLHSHKLEIKSIKINEKSANFSFGENDALIIEKSGSSAEYEIFIEFSGEINDHMHGMYPCYYDFKGEKKELIATQFESHHAREVFPCVDEPEAKASYDVTLTTETGVTVLGNMPIKNQSTNDNNLVTTFDTTPVMSSYLLAWVIGDLHKKTAHTKSGVEVNVWATIAQPIENFDFALDIAVRSTEYFDEYFGTAYPLPKCDHVALPDFSSGAMENWGLITYREVLLLENPKTTSIAGRRHIALVIAHELSHQWFGNLVTMKWWNDLWLNESFATLIEYMAIDNLQPDWNIWLDFASAECIYALRRDRLDGVQSVQTDVNHPDEIGTLFDGAIVYAKGARLLKMLKRYIGDEAFQKGLQSYFAIHAYKNTEAVDLWNALSKSSGKDVAAFMTSWISQPGFPVLHASIESGKVKLTQNRISDVHNVQKSLWPIPLFSNCEEMPKLFDEFESIINVTSNNIKFNIGSDAHYITDCSPELLDIIVNDLKSNKLGPIDRMQLLNEIILLAQSKVVSNAKVVDLVQYYQDEPSEPVWDIIGLSIGEIKKFVDDDEKIESKLKQLSQKLALSQYERLGWTASPNESEDDSKLRAGIIGLMLYGDNEQAISKAKELFETEGINNLNPELRSLIIGTVVKYSEDEKITDSLFELYKTSDSAELKQDICAGLTATRNQNVAKKLLESVKDTSAIRTQDTHMWVIYLIRNKYTRELSWQWIRDNWDWIEKTFGGDKGYGDYPRYVASALSTQQQLDEFITFFNPKVELPALTRSIKMGIQEITEKVDIINADRDAVRQALDAIQI